MVMVFLSGASERAQGSWSTSPLRGIYHVGWKGKGQVASGPQAVVKLGTFQN